jgi:glucose-6-phosphate-specific signal transduction histidine kinase
VSKVTKHKDPKTLKKYIHEDIGQKMTTASMIGKRVSANMSTIETAEDIEEASEEEVEHIKKKRSYSDDDDDLISGRK